MERYTRNCILSAAAFLLACTPSSATAQEDCEYWAGILSGRNAIERVKACLEAGADVNAADRSGETALHEAARFSDHAEVILALVNVGADVHARRFDGGTPLHTAVASGDSPQVVEALVAAGADVNARDNAGNTPLHSFGRWSYPAVARRLLELGADPMARNDAGRVAYPAHVNVGADVHARRFDGGTPLHTAVASGDSPQVVEALVAAGADVNARDNAGNTPLHSFGRWSYPAVARRLLELGADPMARNDAGRVAYPAHCENWNTVGFTRMASASEAAACVTEGRDVNAPDEFGDTPLHKAIERNALRLAELLLASGANPDITNHHGASPLHRAAGYNSVRVQPLLDAGADIDLRDGSGAAPLHAAERDGEVIDLLLAAGADARAVDDWGRTTLHTAALSDSVTIASLVAAGADPSVRDLRGRTALHEAAEWGYHTRGVTALVAAGADVNAADAVGNTPLHLAWSRAARSRRARLGGGHPEIVAKLLELGADPASRNDRGQLPNPADCENWNTVSFTRAAPVPVFAECLASDREVDERDGAGDTPLHLAVSEWEEEVAVMLLEAGADPNARNLQGLSPLHLVAAELRADTVLAALLLASGADPNERDNGGRTPLHRAVTHPDTGIVMLLLRAGAELEARDNQGLTPLPWAMNAARATGPAIEALLAAGADVRVFDQNGETPLHRAVDLQDRQLVARLLELGADPNAAGWGGRTALHIAGWGPAPVLQELLAAGADVRARTLDGQSPLHSAATARDLAGLPALLAAGADVNARDNNGETPLHRAARSRAVPNVAALLAAGADANATTAAGDTPLHYVVGSTRVWSPLPPSAEQMAGLFSQDTAIAAALIRAGADVNARNNEGDTPLRLAREDRNTRLAEALVDFGAEPDADTGAQLAEALVCNWSVAVFAVAPVESIRVCIDAGADVPNTTLHTVAGALQENHALAHHLITVFLQAGADPNARDPDGATPLHLASAEILHRPSAKRGQSAVVDALLAGGADPNARDEAGATPLHHIARGRFDNAATAVLLLEAGADPNARDRDGQTPLHAALTQRNPRVADRLLDYGADPGGRNIGPTRRGDPPAVAGLADCEDWPGPNFFSTATADVVQRCIEGGAEVMSAFPHEPVSWDPNPTRLYSEGATPLHVAAGWTRDVEVITLLADAGADVNALDPYGYTPLHRAARDNTAPGVITALLEAGADPMASTAGAQDEYLARGVTPLHEAAANDNPAIAARLLAAGADVNARATGGRTPLHVAAAENANPAVAEVLLEAAADVNAKRSGGRTPLHEAAAHGNAAVVATLLAAGADAGARGREDPAVGPTRRAAGSMVVGINVWGGYREPLPIAGSRTPLHEAAAANSDPAVTLALIEAGADVHVKADLDRQHESAGTPVYWAAAANPNPAIIEVLAAAGADVNAAAGSERTPLHIAARQNPVVFPALLRLGADPTTVDRQGKTPLDYAAENAWLEVLEVVRRTLR